MAKWGQLLQQGKDLKTKKAVDINLLSLKVVMAKPLFIKKTIDKTIKNKSNRHLKIKNKKEKRKKKLKDPDLLVVV